MPEWCEITALQEKLGDWCFIQAIAYAWGSLTLEGLSVQISATLGVEMAKEEQLDYLLLLGNPTGLSWLICPGYAALTTFHYMNGYLLGFTQFILFWSEGEKNVTSQQRSASNGAGSFTLEEKEKEDVIFLFLLHAACRNQMTSMSNSQRPFFFVTSVHVQFIQKVRQHSLKVNHSTVSHYCSFSITTQLQYLWELLLTERLFRCPPLPSPPPHPTSPYLPFSLWSSFFSVGLF